MKDIVTYITESNANKAMFDACMALENEKEVYPQFKALANAVEKKIKSGEFSFDHLVNSSSVDKLITACIKLTKETIDSKSRKELRKYFAACVLKLVQSSIELPKDIENLLMEWEFYNGDHKIEW